MRRLQAVLAGTLILFGNLKGLAGAQCPVHETARATQVAGPHSAHSHTAHSAPAHDKSSHHDGCTCLEHCQSCLSLGLAAVPPRLQETAIYLDAAAASAVPVSRIPFRAPYQLPFATAPPAIA
jgi:hypothetical protein